MMLIWHKENSRFVPEDTYDEDYNYRFLYLLPRPYFAGTDNILGGMEQDCPLSPSGIFYQVVQK